MDAQAKKKALYRAKLKAQKQEKRIDSPLVRYNESDQPVCKVCEIVLKSESSWSAHQISAKHREAIKIFKANAAAANKVSNMNPGASAELHKAKPEHPAESNKNQTGPPQAQPKPKLPSDFFDKPEAKREQSQTTNAKLTENGEKKRSFDGENLRVENSSFTVAETIGSETNSSNTRSLPEGFFDDKDADLRARGITPVKLDIKDEYKEFEKSIQEDLKEVDNRLEEEEYDAADMIEEAETAEQKYCRERVEIFKRKKMELKAAAATSGKSVKRSKVVEKESSEDESDEDSDDAVDWRAKHL